MKKSTEKNLWLMCFLVIVATAAIGGVWVRSVSGNGVSSPDPSQGTGCVTVASGGGWQNTAISPQTGTFTAEFDATPTASPIDSVVGLSRGAQTAYTGFATLARFNPTGSIDARNGGAYAAASNIPYSANVTYHFRMAVNAPARTYSVFVRPAGGSELTVGTNFAFRTEQNTVTSLDWWGTVVNASTPGSTTVCNFTIGGTEPGPLRTFRVSSLSDLQSRINSALPGDLIILNNGIYTSSATINIDRQGTSQNPITISADTTGGAEIRGSASFSVNSPAAWIVIRGFRLTHSIGTVQVRAGTSHCRITRNVFQLTGTGRYLLVSGDDCEVDHNTFQNKSTEGQMFSIHGPGSSGMAQRTWVHHNLFQNFTSIGGNGGETLQIGLSGRSLTDAHTLVENNLFLNCNGENELISNKSSANTFRYNTIQDSTSGELTLRHGNDCVVHSNFFLNTAGLRFFGDDHQIYSNYFEDCDPGIQIGNGDGDVANGAPLTSHDRPDRVRVSYNTLVNNNQSVIMPGRTNGLGATALVFSNNIIQTNTGVILDLGGPAPNATFQGNIVFGSATNGDMPTSGARRVNPLLSQDSFSIFRLQSTSPAINTGVGSFPEVTIDLDGHSRSGTKDVGADEFSTAPVVRRPLTTANVGPNAP
ncbi:MAG TPA: polysaccharide lyase 6 family protein [Blastocatellia bacterium]|nr:polysaccharide lyase 6 family protein [Blastocatellia bacterium]